MISREIRANLSGGVYLMIKIFKKNAIALLSVFLTCCSSSITINKSFFDKKDWTVWKSDNDNYALFISRIDRTNIKGMFSVFDNNQTKYIECTLSFKHHRDYNKNYIIPTYVDSGNYYYNMKKVKEGDNYLDSKILIQSFLNKDETVLTLNYIDESNIDMRCVYWCGLNNNDYNINFAYLHFDDTLTTGCQYVSVYNEKEIKLSFGNNKSFTITDGTNYTTGTYNATKEGVTLNIEDNHIFDESIKSLNYTYNFY